MCSATSCPPVHPTSLIGSSMLSLSTSPRRHDSAHMLTLSTPHPYDGAISTAAARPARKPRSRYHHDDLRRALIDEAMRTIHHEGVDALTVREAGQRLGVSRTALYRHFSDKSALLAAVARDGFQRFRQDLVEAWEDGGPTRDGFDRMGRAYVSFA